MKQRYGLLRLLLILALIGGMAQISRAQSAQTVISIGVLSGTEFAFTETILPKLAEANPTIQYRVVPIDWPQTSIAEPEKLARYDEVLQRAVRSADVLLVGYGQPNVYGTRAGYFLDLGPLVSADKSIVSADFLPGAWAAHQWENGRWALPLAYSVGAFGYDPKAFEAAGLTPPTAAWSLDDIANAARKLAVRSGDKITMPGLVADDRWLRGLFQALTKDSMAEPTFAPTLTKAIETWAQLEREGVVTRFRTDDQRGKIPLELGDSATFADRPTWVIAPLPGGSALLDVIGLAISKGTATPDQAYQTVKSLIGLRAFGIFGGTRSARRDEQGSFYAINPTPANRAILDALTPDAPPINTLLFGDYLRSAIELIKAGTAADAAVARVAGNVRDLLRSADDARSKAAIVVENPTPSAKNPAKPTLKFIVYTGAGYITNIGDWKTAAKEFAATDPQIGTVDVQAFTPTTPDWGDRLLKIFDTNDCAYMTFAQPEPYFGKVLSLDALTTADPTFNANDFPAAMLASLRQNNQLIAYPVSYLPSVLRYDVKAFARVGLPTPTNDWTIDQFVDALKTLKPDSPDRPPFYLGGGGATTLFSLIAAFGGLPIDARNPSATVDYTSPKVVDAIRQTLDLAKNGYMEYLRSAAFIHKIKQTSNYRMYADVLNITSESFSDSSTFGSVLYPRGSAFTPVSYSPTLAMIGAKTSFPDACYRWIRYFSARADVVNGIPASAQVIASERTLAVKGKVVAQFFKDYQARLTSPNAIPIQPYAGVDTALLWLLRAFDRYVMDGKDLDAELKEAEQFTNAYLICDAGQSHDVPPSAIYFNDGCAKKIDPTILDSISARG